MTSNSVIIYQNILVNLRHIEHFSFEPNRINPINSKKLREVNKCRSARHNPKLLDTVTGATAAKFYYERTWFFIGLIYLSIKFI